MEQRRSGHPWKHRFSRENPPPNEEAARTRLDEIDVQIAAYEARLQNAFPDDFVTDGDYHQWRNRTTFAMGYEHAERKFLDRWLRKHVPKPPPPRKIKPENPLVAIADSVRALARQRAEELERAYAPKYSAGAPPATPEEAQARWVELVAIRQRVQEVFTEVTNAWCAHPLNRSDLPGVKAPLQPVLRKIEEESAVIRKCARAGLDRTTLRQVRACMRALERAVATGFMLNPNERMALDALRAAYPVRTPLDAADVQRATA